MGTMIPCFFSIFSMFTPRAWSFTWIPLEVWLQNMNRKPNGFVRESPPNALSWGLPFHGRGGAVVRIRALSSGLGNIDMCQEIWWFWKGMYLVQMRSFSFDVQIPAISCWEEILRSQRRDVFFFFGTILELGNMATKTSRYQQCWPSWRLNTAPLASMFVIFCFCCWFSWALHTHNLSVFGCFLNKVRELVTWPPRQICRQYFQEF